MTQRFALVCCAALMCIATGCTTNKFAGEWIEQGRYNHAGEYIKTEGPRRMALKFEPISTIRAGAYVDAARVVDMQAVTNDTYVVMQDGTVAQFGSMIARVNGDHMMTYVGAEQGREFVRYHGPSVFPPRVWIPSLESSQ